MQICGYDDCENNMYVMNSRISAIFTFGMFIENCI